MENLVFILPLFGVLALIFVFWRSSYVSKMDVGTEKMAKIAEHIAVGAMALCALGSKQSIYGYILS